jgi:hypothetical protein
VKLCEQLGHLTAWPSKLSGTRKVRWHDGQEMVEFMRMYLAEEVVLRSPLSVRTGYFVFPRRGFTAPRLVEDISYWQSGLSLPRKWPAA